MKQQVRVCVTGLRATHSESTGTVREAQSHVKHDAWWLRRQLRWHLRSDTIISVLCLSCLMTSQLMTSMNDGDWWKSCHVQCDRMNCHTGRRVTVDCCMCEQASVTGRTVNVKWSCGRTTNGNIISLRHSGYVCLPVCLSVCLCVSVEMLLVTWHQSINQAHGL